MQAALAHTGERQGMAFVISLTLPVARQQKMFTLLLLVFARFCYNSFSRKQTCLFSIQATIKHHEHSELWRWQEEQAEVDPLVNKYPLTQMNLFYAESHESYQGNRMYCLLLG